MNCKICNSPTQYFGTAKVMGKYMATYLRCSKCAFIFVAGPTWLKEAYESPINQTDIGTVNRMMENSRTTKLIIDLFLRKSGRCLDYGAGYGLFVRRMRDLGYDFTAYDRYCKNIFAANFQVACLVGQQFDIVTAFEVMEHVEAPLEIFSEIFAHADAVLFSTEIVPEPAPRPGQWWYYGLDHGQHISFYAKTALEQVASAFGKRLSSYGGLHLISSKRIACGLFRISASRTMGKVWELVRTRPSLLPTDFERLRSEHLAIIGSNGGKPLR